MNPNKRIRIWIVILLSGAVLLTVVFWGVGGYRKEAAVKKYSVVLYQHTENAWTSLLAGIRQAATDARVDVNYVTLPQNGTADDAIDLLKREEENGAEGILLAAVDSNGLRITVDDLKTRIPVVTVETGVGGNTEEADVTADNYAMGQELGKRVVEDMQARGEPPEGYSVAIITEFMERSSVVLRYQGLRDYLEGQEGISIMEWKRSEGDYDLSLLIAKMVRELGRYAAVVALDKYATEALIDAYNRQEDQEFSNLWYGFGSTEKIVNGLDEGKLTALMFQNEFNMGYLGLNRLLDGKAADDETIMYKIVTGDTLYEKENQRLMFPIN